MARYAVDIKLKQLTAENVPGRNTVVIAAMVHMAVLSRLAASAMRLWSSDMVFRAALSRMLRALSFCAIRL